MLITEPKIDAVFREYADLQFLRHQMLIAGKNDTAEIAQTEDRMTELWEQLDENQRRSLNGMASDLNWIRHNGEPPPNGRKLREEVSEDDRQRFKTVMECEAWNEILHHLRLCAPWFSPVDLALLRGRAYNALELPTYGRAFFEQAAEFAATNAYLEAAAHDDQIGVGK